MKHLIWAVIAALALNTAQAAEVAGVRFEDKTTLGNSELIANGAGMRKKAFFKVYAMALYLPEKQGEAEGALSVKGAKRISISLLRDLSAQQFVDALQEGIAENHSETEMSALKDRVRQFSEAMLTVGEAKTGTAVLIDWTPENGTHLSVNGQTRGKNIAGEDFYRAILRIWLGNKPVQGDLKQALLGKTS